MISAITDLKARGLRVTFYPFVMMDIPAGNGFPDPYGAGEQPAFPWRGRISCHPAPGQPLSVNATADARSQVSGFLGQADTGDFSPGVNTVQYNGPQELSFRRMILHYAHLCEMAGGVDTFLIGSEMRGLTQVRDEADKFPFVEGLVQLASDCRQILGTGTKISYAADWSEYFGHHPGNPTGDVFFNLDPLWASQAIDAVAIDNYMPMSNWHEDGDHTLPEFKSRYDCNYLKSNIAGGEGMDWYYASDTNRMDKVETAITDGQGEPWIWAYKDIKSWWENPHHDRIDGIRSPEPGPWQPMSKPIWFSELGCPAVDRGTNQPNLFVDSKSSESALPHFSRGSRDDLALLQYARAQLEYWSPANIEHSANNPVSPLYQQSMITLENMAFWAWDTRPYPAFPQLIDIWRDGPNWYRGHWLNGRIGTCPLDDLLAAILEDFGIETPDCQLDGHYQGYVISGESSARAALEPFLVMNNISFSEENGRLTFKGKAYLDRVEVSLVDLVQESGETMLSLTRQSEIELPREVIISHADIDVGYDTQTSSSRRLETISDRQVKLEMPVVLNRENAIGLSNARLRDFWIGRDGAKLKLPWKFLNLTQGDILELENNGSFQIRSMLDGMDREIEANAVSLFEETASPIAPLFARQTAVSGSATPHVLVMNLPLVQEQMDPEPRLYFAATAHPWKSGFQINTSPGNTGFQPVASITDPATVFELENSVAPGPLGRWDYASTLDVTLAGNEGEFESLDPELVFAGENAVAIQTTGGPAGQVWEVLQFQQARLIGTRRWQLSKLLRGQLGTDFEMASGIAAGAEGVVLNSAIVPVFVERSQVSSVFNWLVGASGKDFSQSETVSGQAICSAINSRPLSPCHLQVSLAPDGHAISWIRRSRMGGDNWQYVEVPLEFASERYRIEIFDAANRLVRSETVTEAGYFYAGSERTGDLGSPSAFYHFSVSQLSNTAEAGPPATIAIIF